MKISKYYPPHDKNETEPIWLSPVFAIFQAPQCKVIRVETRTSPRAPLRLTGAAEPKEER